MNILLVTPAPPRSQKGNRITALRWRRILRKLGHRVALELPDSVVKGDLLVALHARHSAQAILNFSRRCPRKPIVLALTGTDLYRDIQRSAAARRSLELADRLVLLQPAGQQELPEGLHDKVRVIYQSATFTGTRPIPLKTVFEVCVVGHLRPVKDPFRCAYAARQLPQSSRLRVVHIGAALTADMKQRAQQEMARNKRYRWLGELPRWQTRRRLARSRLLVLTSQMEGGANVITEAVTADVPVLASHISGSIGLLGCDYPGYFDAGDTRGLAQLLERVETSQSYYREIHRHCQQRKRLFQPAREQQSWRTLLHEFTAT
ncbi:MAG: selenoneine biosynthesis selenosugar synthase SenB [Planctomycetota bacterium]|nr:selenoneine biosynthesis selenosugar synthase SenB [Planctomycetota bacterium]